MKKVTSSSISKLSLGLASIALTAFLAGGSAHAANLSPLYSKQVDPELPFQPFPSEIEYTPAETPWALQESSEEDVPVETPEVTDPTDANYEDPEAPFAPVEEVTDPTDANYEDPEAPFAPVEEETNPAEANYVNPEDPFAEGVPANGENPEAPYGEGYPANGVNPEAPYSEGSQANYTNPEAPFADSVVEDSTEEPEEVTEPSEANYEDPEAPFAPIEETGQDLTPLEPAEELIDLAKPAPLKFQEVEDGTVISAIDYVTNKDEFPEGTSFNFIDYKTKELSPSKELVVAPNPTSRNEYLVIRASHPDAVKDVDSTRFTVVVNKTPESVILVRPQAGSANRTVADGTEVSAADYVANKDEFPEGTEFNFIDYKTKEVTPTKKLVVDPNPKSRNHMLVVRASHPLAEKAMDSYSFTVVAEKV